MEELIHKDMIQRLADLEKKHSKKRKEIDGKSTCNIETTSIKAVQTLVPLFYMSEL